jgi:hypothetical protein
MPQDVLVTASDLTFTNTISWLAIVLALIAIGLFAYRELEKWPTWEKWWKK